MRVDDFDFELPPELIALHPAEPRYAARLLVVQPGRALVDAVVTDLTSWLRAGDVLVVNDTRVLPAELTGTRLRGENRAQVSFNLHKRVDAQTWLAFARPAKRLAVGDRLQLGDDESLAAEVIAADFLPPPAPRFVVPDLPIQFPARFLAPSHARR